MKSRQGQNDPGTGSLIEELNLIAEHFKFK